MKAKIPAVAAVAAMLLAGCSSSTDSTAPAAAPTTGATTTVSAPTSSTTPVSSSAPTSSTAPTSSCFVNPSTAPVPAVEPYGTVPEVGRITVALSGIPTGVTSGSAPTDVDVTLCNDSAVDYPQVGVVLVLRSCSCAPNPMSIPKGTVERFDEATASWVQIEHPVAGTGMDYLGGYSNVQELPRGRTVTLRYRVALDVSMTAGDGGVEAAAVTPEPLNQIGSADLPFTVRAG